MLHTIYFIYGLCVMFYFMMSWLFFHKDKELLSRLVAVLMLVIGVQCLKILLIANSIYADYIIEALYMSISLVVWIFINYYIYKHESVLDELSDNQYTDVQDAITSDRKDSYIRKHITDLFENEKIYLNPNLKVSDIAAAIGTNRTYISAYFNKETQCTFYDYVNRYRIEYACKLLENSNEKILQIAELSGFNSSQAFIRVFTKIKGISPSKYRKERNR